MIGCKGSFGSGELSVAPQQFSFGIICPRKRQVIVLVLAEIRLHGGGVFVVPTHRLLPVAGDAVAGFVHLRQTQQRFRRFSAHRRGGDHLHALLRVTLAVLARQPAEPLIIDGFGGTGAVFLLCHMDFLLFVLGEQVHSQRALQSVLIFVRLALVQRVNVAKHFREPPHVGFLQNDGDDGNFPLQRAGNFLGHHVAAGFKSRRRDQQHKDIHALQSRVDLSVVILAGGEIAVEPHGAVIRVEYVPRHVVAVDHVLLAVAQEHHAQTGRVGDVSASGFVGKYRICHDVIIPPCFVDKSYILIQTIL